MRIDCFSSSQYGRVWVTRDGIALRVARFPWICFKCACVNSYNSTRFIDFNDLCLVRYRVKVVSRYF